MKDSGKKMSQTILQQPCRGSVAARCAGTMKLETSACNTSQLVAPVTYRAPKTVLDFFKPKPASHSQEKSKKRNSSEALHEIQVNGGDSVKRVKSEPGDSRRTRNVQMLISSTLW